MPGIERDREYEKISQKACCEVTTHKTKISFVLGCMEKFKGFYGESC